MKMKITLNLLMISLIVLLLLNTRAFSQDQNFYIFLCFGQSNMEGQGAIQVQDKTVDSRFQVLQALECSNLGRSKATWYTAVPPLCQCWSGLSPADYFGRTMVENLPDSIKVGVINVAVGGCDIRLFDKDIYQDYDSTYSESWFTNKVKDYEWNPYQYLIDLAQLAQQDGVIKGILLHQGETNNGDAQWPSYVKKIYTDILTDLSLGADSVPLLAGEVLSAEGNCCSAMNTIINRLPDTIPTAYVISSSGCAGQDNAHFNSEGYRILGRRYGMKMLSLLGIEPDSSLGVNSIEEINGYVLGQNYPNPFNPATKITFTLPEKSFVTLNVYDALGREASNLVNGEMFPGTYSRQWNAAGLSSGIYFYRLEAGSFIETRKLVLLR